MSNFDDELNGYIKAQTESTLKQQAKEQYDAVLAALPYPHPEDFFATPNAPEFAQHPLTQMWHDGSTGTFSYYDTLTGTYIPVEGPDSPFPSSNHMNNTSVPCTLDPVTGYPVDLPLENASTVYELPPESDATLRLCVLSSNVLKVGGVLMVDGSGISFGRDKPMSGQGQRVRMVEMEVSRFHANIYLDRQQVPLEEPVHEHSMYAMEQPSTIDTQSVLSTTIPQPTVDSLQPLEKGEKSSSGDSANANVERLSEESSFKSVEESAPRPNSQESNPGTEVNHEHSQTSDDQEDGELPDTPTSNNSNDKELQPPNKSMMTLSSDNNTVKSEEELCREYKEQMEQYQQYYQQFQRQEQASPVTFVDTFQIIDCGSTHGTILNGQRLSEPKTASQPFALKHLDRLQVGSTTFEVHAHEEGKICSSCQVKDDNEIVVLDDKERDRDRKANESANIKNKNAFMGDLKLNMEQERIEEMNRLRKKWAGPSNSGNNYSSINNHNNKRPGRSNAVQENDPSSRGSSEYQQREYVDRAAKRRLHHPDNSRPVPSVVYPVAMDEPTSGFHVPVAASNKGHAMLSKMGWKAGTGLGATRQGVVEPVQLVVAESTAGLGSSSLQTQGTAAARKPETPGEAARRRARERFAQLQSK